jgi:hypothetical protein
MWKAVLFNFLVFGVLFGLHIVFASAGWSLAFSVVALAISVQIVLFGPLTVVLEGSPSRWQRRSTNRIAGVVGLPLSIGLAWAYGGMAWAPMAVLVVVGLMLTCHLVLDVKLAEAA